MRKPDETKFSFEIAGLPPDVFYVVRFTGEEGLSQLFHFTIDLLAETPDLDLEDLIQKQAVLTIHGDADDMAVHGVTAGMEQRQGGKGLYFYRAVLVPKLSWLTLVHHNQVFLDQTVDQIIESVLKDGGLTGADYELRLVNQYPEWDYVCQYNETNYNFLRHWMEKYGLYFFFEHPGGKLIITDSRLSHVNMSGSPRVDYSPPSGLDHEKREEVLQSYFCRQQTAPQKVILQDYNYRKPSLKIIGEKEVKENGLGQVYYYAQHFRTPEEGAALASVRAESFLCQEKLFAGQSSIPYFRSGYTFDLTRHYREDYNQGYLAVNVKHQGDQAARLAGFFPNVRKVEDPFYKNQFTAIASDLQYRTEFKTPRSRFYGTLHAVIDAAGSSTYAELDDQGRYKVILPFDLSGRQGGKASSWIRMMQPYAGSNHGMHFPLHKGAEVLLTFIDGDPDRPVIAGALPNPENPSVVTSTNNTMAALTTSGGNKIHMEDSEGSQRILMQSPSSNTFFRMGEPNDPAYGDDWYDVGYSNTSGVRIFSIGDMDVKVSNNTSTILGRESDTIMGMKSETVLGSKSEMVFGSKTNLTVGWENNYRSIKNYLVDQWNTIKSIGNFIGEVGSFIYDTATYVGEKAVRAVTSHTHVSEETVWVNEEWMKAHESEEAIVADVWRNVMEEVEIIESSEKIIADETTVIDAKTDVIEELTEVVESATTVASSQTIVAESSNEVETDKNIVASSVNII